MPEIFVFPHRGKNDVQSIRTKEAALEAYLRQLHETPGEPGPAGPPGPAGEPGTDGAAGPPGSDAASGQMTIGVAAVDARQSSKDRADFICDGVDDQVTIQAAIATLGTLGGRVVLSEGRFTIGATGIILSNVHVHFQGMGSGVTELFAATVGTPFFVRVGTSSSENRNVVISDIAFHGADKAVSGITIVQAVNSTVRVQNCVFHDFTSHGVNLARPAGNWQFHRCHFYANGAAGAQSREAHVSYFDCIVQSNTGGGIGIQQDSDGFISRCNISNNAGFGGIQSGNAISQGFSDFHITDNLFENNTGYAINIADGSNNQIADNIFQSNTTGSIALGAGAFGVSSNNLIMGNNQVGTGTFVTVASGSSTHRSNNVVNGVLIDVPPGDPATMAYTHVQGVASTLWTINHPLGFRPNVVVVDSTGEQVEGEVDYIDLDTVTVGFSAAFSGTAYLS